MKKRKIKWWHIVIIIIVLIVILRVLALSPAFYRYVGNLNHAIEENQESCDYLAKLVLEYQYHDYYGDSKEELCKYQGSYSDYLKAHKDFLDYCYLGFWKDNFKSEEDDFDVESINSAFIYKVKNAHFELIIDEDYVEVYIPELIDKDGNAVSSGKIMLAKLVTK